MCGEGAGRGGEKGKAKEGADGCRKWELEGVWSRGEDDRKMMKSRNRA